MLWTDTRFDRAHRFHEKRVYVRAGRHPRPGRSLESLEFRYAKPAAGLVVDALDAAAARQRRTPVDGNPGRLRRCRRQRLLLRPLAPEMARDFWRKVASDVAGNRRVLLAAWLDGALVGTVQLDLDMPQNQPHRAELTKLLVAPAARRRGVARALLQRAEQAAQRLKRPLLVLDTEAGSLAEPLYRSLGWQEAGRIPRFALDVNGTEQDAVFFWKRV